MSTNQSKTNSFHSYDKLEPPAYFDQFHFHGT